MQRLTTVPAWHALMDIKATQPYDLRRVDRCGQNYSLSQCGITLDFDLQFLTAPARQRLFDLANASKFEEKINALFSGSKINFSEDRAALHTALRAPLNKNKSDVGEDRGGPTCLDNLAAKLSYSD